MQMLQPNPIDRLAALDQLAQVLDALIATSDPPSGNTVEERAVERRSAEPVVAIGPTQFGERIAPDGFFDSTIFPKTQFFANESVRFSQIESTLGFYREHLSKEYEHLLAQANLTYRLWLGCVGLGFLVLIGGVVNMLLGRIAEGAATSASTIIIFFIQKIFQQREDHYRALAKSKNSHLEYGDQWRLVIQSIDSIEEPSERARKQARLVEVLTEKLAGGSRALGSP
jgi:hypothetical protein